MKDHYQVCFLLRLRGSVAADFNLYVDKNTGISYRNQLTKLDLMNDK